MATFAKQVDFLLNGYRTPITDVILGGGKVTTKLAGTSTLSALWTDREKTGQATNPIILGSDGSAEVFGDNIYDFFITDSDDNPVDTISGLEYNIENEYRSPITLQNALDTTYAFDTVSDMVAAAWVVVGQRVKTLGYHDIGDGGDNYYKIVAAATGTDDGGTFIDLDTHQASGLFPEGKFNIIQFGAFKDSANDSSVAMNAVIQASPTDIQTIVDAPGGTYRLEDTVHIDRSVLFECEGRGQLTTNANTSPPLGVTFVWNGAAGGTMFLHSVSTIAVMDAGTATAPAPDITGEAIVGGGIDGACLDGNEIANRGIWSASTKEAVYKVQVRKFINVGIQCDGGNGILSTRNDFVVHVVFGADVSVQGMSGISFRRYNGFPSTQNTIEKLWGLVFDGDGCLCGDTDNNLFHHTHIVTQSGGTGRAITFRLATPQFTVTNGESLVVGVRYEIISQNTLDFTTVGSATNNVGATFTATGAGPLGAGDEASAISKDSRNNLCYYISGDVHAENGTFGNRIVHHNSEGAGITSDPTGQIHYEALDYINAELFTTLKYDMDGEWVIDSNAMRPDGAVAVSATTAGGSYSGIAFPDSGDGSAFFNVPSKREWNDGEIIGIDIYSWNDTADSGDVLWRIFINLTSNGDAFVTPEIDKTTVQDYGIVAFTYTKTSFTFINAEEFLRGQSLLCRLERQPGNELDTKTGGVSLLGVAIKYTSFGPNSAGSGQYDVTAPFV